MQSLNQVNAGKVFMNFIQTFKNWFQYRKRFFPEWARALWKFSLVISREHRSLKKKHWAEMRLPETEGCKPQSVSTVKLKQPYSHICVEQNIAKLSLQLPLAELLYLLCLSSFVPHTSHLLSSPLYGVSDHTNHTFSETSWHSVHYPLTHCPLTTHPSPTQTHQTHQAHPSYHMAFWVSHRI